MCLRYRVGLVCLLVLTGCGENTSTVPPTTTTGATGSPAATTATSETSDSTGATAPVARLLGQPVHRSDLLSKSSGIGSAEVGIHRLVLGVLMRDFCDAQKRTLTKEEIDAFWQRLKSLRPEQNVDPNALPFDDQQVRSKIDETRAKLAAPNVAWLERHVLEGQLEGQQYALEHQSVSASVAHSMLLPMKCIDALYKHYGGKVVARQISIEPAEAYLKLAQDAEKQGKLEFLDEGLKQAFWKRMNDDMNHPEVPPERVDFSMPAIFQGPARSQATAGATANPARSATPASPAEIDRFVGIWNTEAVHKPSKSAPAGGQSTARESTSRILNGRFVRGRELSRPDGVKSLWLMTYDPKTNSYPFWFFNSAGVLGGEWSNTWDADALTFVGKATDTPRGWTSGSKNHFPDANTNEASAWMKDDAGALIFEFEARKTRQPVQPEDTIAAEWARPADATALTDERKVLDRMIGAWDAEIVTKPAEWTPKELRTTASVTREWILNGQVVATSTKISDGQEHLNLSAYDAQARVYRNWWFSSDGNHNKAAGTWDSATQSLKFSATRDDGLKFESVMRVADADRQEWEVKVTGRDGKVYFENATTATRRK